MEGFADEREGGFGGAHGPAAQFHRGLQLQRLDRANAFDGAQFFVRGVGEAGEGALVAVEKLAGQINHALAADARAQEDGHQNVIGHVLNAGFEGQFGGGGDPAGP